MTADLPLPETLLGVTVPRAPLVGDSGARRSAWPAVAPEAQTVEQGTSGSRRRVLAADPPPPDCKVGTRRAEQGRPATAVVVTAACVLSVSTSEFSFFIRTQSY